MSAITFIGATPHQPNTPPSEFVNHTVNAGDCVIAAIYAFGTSAVMFPITVTDDGGNAYQQLLSFVPNMSLVLFATIAAAPASRITVALAGTDNFVASWAFTAASYAGVQSIGIHSGHTDFSAANGNGVLNGTLSNAANLMFSMFVWRSTAGVFTPTAGVQRINTVPLFPGLLTAAYQSLMDNTGNVSVTCSGTISIPSNNTNGRFSGTFIELVAFPISITPGQTLENAIKDIPYSQTLKVSGGLGPYTSSVTAGSLPPGLSLGGTNNNGIIFQGTPTTTGTFTFTVQVCDSVGNCTTGNFDIEATGAIIDTPLPRIGTLTTPTGKPVVWAAYDVFGNVKLKLGTGRIQTGSTPVQCADGFAPMPVIGTLVAAAGGKTINWACYDPFGNVNLRLGAGSVINGSDAPIECSAGFAPMPTVGTLTDTQGHPVNWACYDPAGNVNLRLGAGSVETALRGTILHSWPSGIEVNTWIFTDQPAELIVGRTVTFWGMTTLPGLNGQSRKLVYLEQWDDITGNNQIADINPAHIDIPGVMSIWDASILLHSDDPLKETGFIVIEL